MTDTTPQLKILDIEWPTNINGKMSCNSFVHITLEPDQRPLRHEVERTVFRIVAKDGSHSPVLKKISEIGFTKYEKLVDWLTYSSHGVNTHELVSILEKHHNTQVFMNTRIMVLYFTPFEMEDMG